MTEAPFLPLFEEAGASPFLLSELEVFNWGPFHGKHRCEIDPGGTSIIGPTGSGKTTLVDALMTLLALYPKYNLASTGGHESDRELTSYVRGVSGVESLDGESSHLARPGSTVTGLAATYTDGREKVVLGAILSVEGSSNASEDLKKLWFFAKDLAPPLDQLLRLHHEEGKAAIMRLSRETAGLRVFGSKRDYLALARGFFDVGENAFSLLNRAAGLKQINSIDQIFRELVLDDHSAFDRAREVVQEFDNLQSIHTELETARRQRDSLLPVSKWQTALEDCETRRNARRHLKTLLPVWFAALAARLWQAERERAQEAVAKLERTLEEEGAKASAAKAKADALNQVYLNLGGASIQMLEENILANERIASDIRHHAETYWASARRLGLSGEQGETSFQSNLAQLTELKATMTGEHEKARDASLKVENELRQHQHRHAALREEIREIQARPHSNLPSPHQTFRESLATHLNLSPDWLPFLAELIEVKPEESRWRGAIERAVGSERLRILVPQREMRRALAWIDQRHNRMDVRLQSVGASPAPLRSFGDGFTSKLNYREHPFRAMAEHLLVRRDRHCVESVEELRVTEHAMTVEGTMSDRDGRFEKQDQRPLGEGWMTGFDNRHQLAQLGGQLSETENVIRSLEGVVRRQRTNEMSVLQEIGLIEGLQGVEFHKIDPAPVEKKLSELRARRAELVRPDSDASRAKLEYEAVVEELRRLDEGIRRILLAQGGHQSAADSAAGEVRKAEERRGAGLGTEDEALAAKEFSAAEASAASDLAQAERHALERMDGAIDEAEKQVSDMGRKVINAMNAAKREDTGALAETGVELRDVPAYLKRLGVLQNEALPEKLQRFLDYLNHSSGQGVTQLLTQVDHEVLRIEDRVAELNATLSRVDFQRGYHLQLDPEKIVHESLRQVDSAHRKLRQAALNAGEDQGEAHYRALGDLIRLIRDAVESRKTLGAQALLDPRHRLQFFVVEVERETGRRLGRRSGSQRGSGGEKEMMASYILTASLSYALSPAGAARPRYATIVLDEAFSKTSPAAASRIIEALRVFGLHPLFVTPNKEIALLKTHTRSAILVHNKDRKATLTSLTWEEIAAHEKALAGRP